MEKNIIDFISPSVVQLDLLPTIFSFTVCVLMSFIVREVYVKRSFSLTGKVHIGSIIPVLSAVVFIVIVIVKSSLALSLGLVGALSIVRFRTPIKEPEELVYLFLSIALGIGYASGHILITTVLSLLTLAIIYFWLSNRSISNTSEYNLVIDWKDTDITYKEVIDTISTAVDSMKLIRLDSNSTDSNVVLLVLPSSDSFIDLITSDIKKLGPSFNVTFFEAKTNW
jgi:hypothetical protein